MQDKTWPATNRQCALAGWNHIFALFFDLQLKPMMFFFGLVCFAACAIVSVDLSQPVSKGERFFVHVCFFTVTFLAGPSSSVSSYMSPLTANAPNARAVSIFSAGDLVGACAQTSVLYVCLTICKRHVSIRWRA